MSSVNSNSGTSGTDDRVRKAREDYRKKEAELIKKHNKEIKALNDRYVQQLDKKDELQSKNLGHAREKTQEALTNKDVKYQKEMSELKELHTKQLEKLMTDNRARLEAQSRASRLEVEQAGMGHTGRRDELHDRYEQQRLAQEEKFTQALNELRKDQKDQINESREKFNKKYETDLDKLRGDRDETVSDLKNDYRKLRNNSSQRLKDQEVRHMNDKMRLNSSHMDNIQHETEMHNRQQELSRDGYEEGIKDIRYEMALAREKDLNAQHSITAQHNADVKDRVDSQVNRLERDIRRVKEQSVMERVDTQNSAKKQVNNMRDAYQNKFDYLENARIETLRQSNDINAQNINKITDQTNKQMSENTKYYISKNEMDNLKNRQHIDTIEKEHKLRDEYNRSNADNRVERIRRGANEANATLEGTYKSNLDMLKSGNEEEKKDILLSHVKDKNETISRYKEFLERQEMTHQRKSEDVVNKYEKRLSELNDQFVREKRLRDNREKSLVSEIKRRHDAEIEALKIKYEDQNKQTSVNHERELRDSQRRNQEKLNEVINSMKKT